MQEEEEDDADTKMILLFFCMHFLTLAPQDIIPEE